MDNTQNAPHLYYLPLVRRDDGVLSSQEIGHLHKGDLPLASELDDYITSNYEKIDGIVEAGGRLYRTNVYRPKQEGDYWYALIDEHGTLVPSEDNTTAPAGGYLKELKVGLRDLRYSEALTPQESVSINDAFIEPEFDETNSAGRSHRSVSWRALLEMPRIVIVGAPGAGKTTALRRLALHYFEQWEADNERPFPVYVQMRHLDEGSVVERSFNRFLKTASHAADVDDNVPAVRDTRVVLILDGLDEVGEETRDTIVANVNKIADNNRTLPIIASTREAGYFWQFPSFRYLHIRPLTQEKIREWTFYRLGGRAEWLSFITSLEERQQLKELAGNPLLLSIATSLYRRSSVLPQNRSALLKSYFDAVLEQWDSVRGVVRQREAWAAPARKLSALGRVAYCLAKSGRNSFTDDEFVAWNSSSGQGLPLLYVCERETGVVTRQRDGRWQFYHRVFSDYLTARYIVDDVGSTVDALRPIFRSGGWLDIWSLTCGIAPNADALVLSVLRNRRLPVGTKISALAVAFEQDLVVSDQTFDQCANFFWRRIEESFRDRRAVARGRRTSARSKWAVRSNHVRSLSEAKILIQSLQRLRKSRMASRIIALLKATQAEKSDRLVEMLSTVDVVTLLQEKRGGATLIVTLSDDLKKKTTDSRPD